MNSWLKSCYALPAAAIAMIAVSCGNDTELKDWRSIDLCSLVEPGQVAQLDYSKSADEVTRPSPSTNDVSRICAWGDYISISMKDRTLPDDYESPTHVRYVEIDGRRASVTNERGGRCSVWLTYRDAEMVVNIQPARSKTDVDLDDRSPISCDAQMPLLTSIVSRVDLP